MSQHFQQFLPRIFPGLLGGAYLLAFSSLLSQVPALYGSSARPAYIRLAVYRYQFSNAALKRTQGIW